MSRLDKQEVLRRFCALATKVGGEHFEQLHSHDCFCGDNGTVDFVNGFLFDEEVMNFIEDAVDEAMRHNV